MKTHVKIIIDIPHSVDPPPHLILKTPGLIFQTIKSWREFCIVHI